MEEKELEGADSPPEEGVFPDPTVKVKSILRLLDDWEQDYFVPISLPPHTKAHVDTAIAQLRERIRGLVT